LILAESDKAWGRLLSGPFPGSDAQPGWRDRLPVAVQAVGTPSLDWGESVDTLAFLAQGTRQRLPVVLQGGVDGADRVRFSLLSTQRPIMVKQGGRQVIDRQRTLSLVDPVQFDLGQAEIELRLDIPFDLPQHSWALALRAELLAEDGQRVLANTSTPIRRWPTVAPLQLAVELPSDASLPAGAAEPLVISGRLKRHISFPHAAKIKLTGLPDGYQVPQVIVPADRSQFELPVKFQREAKAAELKDLRLEATLHEVPERLSRVRHLSAPFSLKVTAAAAE
jgi:hypothetical protein